VSESCVTWATSVPILVFLGLSVLDLGPMYATDVGQHHRLMPPPRGRDIIISDTIPLYDTICKRSLSFVKRCLQSDCCC